MIARPLGVTAALMIVLETVRATNLIVRDARLGGAWNTMFCAFTAVATLVLAAYALARRES